MFDNPLLLMILILAIAIMGGYYYFKRAQRRDGVEAEPPAGREEPRADA